MQESSPIIPEVLDLTSTIEPQFESTEKPVYSQENFLRAVMEKIRGESEIKYKEFCKKFFDQALELVHKFSPNLSPTEKEAEKELRNLVALASSYLMRKTRTDIGNAIKILETQNETDLFENMLLEFNQLIGKINSALQEEINKIERYQDGLLREFNHGDKKIIRDQDGILKMTADNDSLTYTFDGYFDLTKQSSDENFYRGDNWINIKFLVEKKNKLQAVNGFIQVFDKQFLEKLKIYDLSTKSNKHAQPIIFHLVKRLIINTALYREPFEEVDLHYLILFKDKYVNHTDEKLETSAYEDSWKTFTEFLKTKGITDAETVSNLHVFFDLAVKNLTFEIFDSMPPLFFSEDKIRNNAHFLEKISPIIKIKEHEQLYSAETEKCKEIEQMLNYFQFEHIDHEPTFTLFERKVVGLTIENLHSAPFWRKIKKMSYSQITRIFQMYLYGKLEMTFGRKTLLKQLFQQSIDIVRAGLFGLQVSCDPFTNEWISPCGFFSQQELKAATAPDKKLMHIQQNSYIEYLRSKIKDNYLPTVEEKLAYIESNESAEGLEAVNAVFSENQELLSEFNQIATNVYLPTDETIAQSKGCLSDAERERLKTDLLHLDEYKMYTLIEYSRQNIFINIPEDELLDSLLELHFQRSLSQEIVYKILYIAGLRFNYDLHIFYDAYKSESWFIGTFVLEQNAVFETAKIRELKEGYLEFLEYNPDSAKLFAGEILQQKAHKKVEISEKTPIVDLYDQVYEKWKNRIEDEDRMVDVIKSDKNFKALVEQFIQIDSAKKMTKFLKSQRSETIVLILEMYSSQMLTDLAIDGDGAEDENKDWLTSAIKKLPKNKLFAFLYGLGFVYDEDSCLIFSPYLSETDLPNEIFALCDLQDIPAKVYELVYKEYPAYYDKQKKLLEALKNE